jgi:hypothetical protein
VHGLQSVEILGAPPTVTAALPGFSGAEGLEEGTNDANVQPSHVAGKDAHIHTV